MRKCKYIEPTSEHVSTPIEIIKTEEDVMREYYPFWCERMLSLGREHLISFETCWQDYKAIHWGEEIKQENV